MLEFVEPVGELDRWIYGAKSINLTARQAHHALERGYLDADKFGRKWRSTKRRLLKPAPATIAAPNAASPVEPSPHPHAEQRVESTSNP
jgi:hypothetical protein